MRGVGRYVVIAVGLLGFAAPEAVLAQRTAKPFEIALYSPAQIRSPDDEILILRLSLLYGSNEAVKGLDLGLVAHNGEGVSKGVQHALVGTVDGDFIGWQAHLAGFVHGEFVGYQQGLYNEVDRGEGVQMGLVNRARDFSGLQLGLVNLSDNLYGLQIGLVNVIRSKDSMAFLPIVNWQF